MEVSAFAVGKELFVLLVVATHRRHRHFTLTLRFMHWFVTHFVMRTRLWGDVDTVEFLVILCHDFSYAVAGALFFLRIVSIRAAACAFKSFSRPIRASCSAFSRFDCEVNSMWRRIALGLVPTCAIDAPIPVSSSCFVSGCGATGAASLPTKRS